MRKTAAVGPASLTASTAPNEQEPIVFGAPLIGEEEIAEVIDTLRSGWLGTGPKTKLFEARFATYVGSRNAVATNSCTAALHLALNALGVGPGDEIITTPLTFVATANVIEHCGVTPVFVDVSPRDGNIDPDAIEQAVSERTKAIMPVHYCGALADVIRIRNEYPDIPIVVDAAHAVEARYPGGRGSQAAATVAAYSFYATKNLVTGEGGMVVSDDDRLIDRIRVRSLHGLDNDAWTRYSGGGYAEYDMDYPGFKYNMTDIQASLGLHQLDRIEQSWARRRVVWERYNEAFCDLDGVAVPAVEVADTDGTGRHALHLYTLAIDWEEVGMERSTFTSRMREHGVGTGWHFRVVHLHRYYREKYGFREGMFPVAEALSNGSVSIPLSAALDSTRTERVVEAVFDSIQR